MTVHAAPDAAPDAPTDATDGGRREPRATFIVRLWREVAGAAGWRGQVEFLQEGERLGVASVEGVSVLLAEWLEREDGTPHEEGRRQS